MILKTILMVVIFILSLTSTISQAFAQTDARTVQTEKQEIIRRHSIGSSLFMLYNFFPDSADFYQLSYGYQVTSKDVFIVEAITWKYQEPLGTYGSSKEDYPGKIRAYGIGAAYKRFLWGNFFTTVEATPFVQQYYDENNKKTQKGFQLYLQVILGYRFEFLNKRLFVEPAYALKYWPVNTNVPKSFADVAKGTPEHIFEPSLNFGYKF